MEHKGKQFDRLYVTSCRGNTLCLSMFPIPHLHETNWHLVPRKTIRGEAGQQHPLNICLCRLKDVQHGWPCVPAGLHWGGHTCLAWTTSPRAPRLECSGRAPVSCSARLSALAALFACRPTCLSDCLSAFSGNDGSAATDEGPACRSSWPFGWIPLVLDEMVRQCVASETRQTERHSKKTMLPQSKTRPNDAFSNVVAQLGRLEGTDTDNTCYGVFYLSPDAEKYSCLLQNKQINWKLGKNL